MFKIAFDVTPEAIEPTLSMMYQMTIAKTVVRKIGLLFSFIAGTTIPPRNIEMAASNPAAIEVNHFVLRSSELDKLSMGQSEISRIKPEGRFIES